MKLLHNAVTLLSQPALAGEYLRFLASRLRHGGQAIRHFPADEVKLGGFSGFSEYYWSAGFIDPRERLFLKEHPWGDGVFLDVGANLGLFSLLLARHHPERVIHAFEPNPSTYAALQANLARNGCLHAHAHARAVAAQEGEIVFEANPVDRATTHIVMENGSPSGGAPVVRVPGVTLDAFAGREHLDAIALLKVDVEGYEELVFQGAERLLASKRARVVYYEVCPELTRRAGFAPEAPGQRLLAHGYRLHTLDAAGHLQPADLGRIPSVTLENWVATAP